MRPETNGLITKLEAAAWLCVCTRSVERLVDLGVLTKVTIGKRAVRFRLSEVLELAGVSAPTLAHQP